RAALLESPDRQRARHAAPEAAERGAGPADEDSLRGDAGGGGAAEGRVPGLGHEEGRTRSGPAPGGGLGAAGDLLRVPEGALETPADDERGRVALRRGAAADGRGEAVQEGRERDGRDLEDAPRRRAELPAPRCAGAPTRGGRGRRIRQRRAREARQREGGRLIFFTHLLTRPRHGFLLGILAFLLPSDPTDPQHEIIGQRGTRGQEDCT